MKYDIEMIYGVNINVSIDAETQEQALIKAKEVVENNIQIIEPNGIDVGDLIFEEATYIRN